MSSRTRAHTRLIRNVILFAFIVNSFSIFRCFFFLYKYKNVIKLKSTVRSERLCTLYYIQYKLYIKKKKKLIVDENYCRFLTHIPRTAGALRTDLG